MTTNDETVLAFDLYGTLLSTSSIAEELDKHFPGQGPSLAATWRKYQLEYTWRLNSMHTYEPFSVVTQRALQHTLTESRLSPSDNIVSSLMASYDSLSTFPDVDSTLSQLTKLPEAKCVVFSNGTASMLENSIKNSPSLTPFAKVFQDLVSVDDIRRYKPDPECYRHVARRVGKSEAHMESIWLISGNPFDVVGARKSGMSAVWVDREGAAWCDKLMGDEIRPSKIVRSLTELLQDGKLSIR